MPWDVKCLSDENVVLVKVVGEHAISDISKMSVDPIALADGLGTTKFIVDLSEGAPMLSTVDVYRMPELLKEIGFKRHSKVALLHSATGKDARTFDFMETVFSNQGMAFRSFGNLEDALQWLK